MKTGKAICNYAIIRFMPYPETEEFVNVGVVVVCSAKNYFGFRLETSRRERVTGFFPELNDKVFIQGRSQFHDELERVREWLNQPSEGLTFPFIGQEFNRVFLDVVKPRESMFRFSGTSTRLAENPEEALAQLFSFYVERQFAQKKEYQETLMTNRLRKTLLAAKVMDYGDGRVGNEMYEVHFPLIKAANAEDRQFRAIKPLCLAKKKPTEITVHGDEWLAKLRHLKDMDFNPNRVLFALQMPKDNDEQHAIRAAEAVSCEIKSYGAWAVLSDESETITNFAKNV